MVKESQKNKPIIIGLHGVRFLFQVVNCPDSDARGLVAQWLEHTLDKRGVASSTLARPTTFIVHPISYLSRLSGSRQSGFG